MKKVFLTVAFAAVLGFTSCKKETTITTETKGEDTLVTIVNEDVKLNEESQRKMDEAKAKLDQAEKDLADAKARGDKKAEEAATKMRDEAKTSWENIKAGTHEAIQDTKEGLKEAGNKIDETAQHAKEDLKEAGKAIGDKAKEIGKDAKEAGKEAGKDIKEGYNNTLEKAKAK